MLLLVIWWQFIAFEKSPQQCLKAKHKQQISVIQLAPLAIQKYSP